MKLLLVTRGSQGDVYPYLRLAAELKSRGHSVTLSLPRLFEKQAKDSGVHYVLQASDDLVGMLEDTPDTKNLLEWTKRVIDSQFRELIPLMAEYDALISTNTEFAAPSIAEYYNKPCIRTAYGPFIPSRTIPPPVFPWPQPHPVIRPVLLWNLLNNGLNLMTKKSLNKNRKVLNMPPIKCQAEHAPNNSANFLMYSTYLGNVDNNWKYQWDIGGYCFNDLLPYNKEDLEEITGFIKKDNRPTVYFSLGSCNVAQRDRFASLLFDICTEHNYKLLLSAGWWNAGAQLQNQDNFFRMDKVIPHCLIFPHCDAIIHHGGVGTTHSAARSGRPQMVTPILLDQFYWGHRVKELGIGPGSVKIKNVSKKQLEQKVVDLVNNPSYKEKADTVKKLIHSEGGLENICRYIENYCTSFGDGAKIQDTAFRKGD
jgi:UDP:flavonoid glycosyltransferase YjiC (YdhE family)